MKKTFACLAATLPLFLAPACGSSETPVTPVTPVDGGADSGADSATAECTTTGNGNVEVRISGLPAGLDADVQVDGLAAHVVATSTLPLSAGPHAVTARTVIKSDPIVRTVFTATSSTGSVCVRNGQTTTVEVTYSKLPSSNQLWMTHGNGTGQVASLPGAALALSSSTSANTFDVGVPSAASVAFDRDGNEWVVSGGGEIRRILARDLGTSGTKTPDITLTSDLFRAGIPGPVALAFDKDGNMVVALAAQKKIVKIPSASYLVENATPTVTIEGAFLDGIGALAFDKAGNLYAAADDKVLRFDAARLAASSTAVPELSLTAQTPQPTVNTLSAPNGLAFDKTGNLWVSYFAANKVARLVPADLAGTGSVTMTPAIQIGIDVTALLEEIAIDESDGLWITYKNGQVARLAPAQLAASADVTPATIVNATSLGSPKGMAFFPAPAALPLYSALP
jgi:sugar lactone lactonase YvrE